MHRYLAALVRHRALAWVVVVIMSVGVALLVALVDVRWQERQRLFLLETEAQRSSLEIRSTTLNGNLMGSITLLGLTDRSIKQEATNGLLSEDANILGTLRTVGNAFDAEGVFVVGEDGIVKTSWDRANKPSTGLDVKFRPYYKMAIQGKSSVYAAVSMARGDRSLYFAVPVFAEAAMSSSGAGAVVARTSLDRVDALLKGRFDSALLLSPQGVVFASSNPKWVGMTDGAADDERLSAIRALKQFGALFEKSTPAALPFSASSGLQTIGDQRFAVAASSVNWNDPYGDWKLVIMEDLGRTLPLQSVAWKAALAAIATLLLSTLTFIMLNSHHRQALAGQQLKEFARQQEASAARNTRIAAATVRLQRAGNRDGLMQVFLQEAHALFGAMQGVVYLAIGDSANGLYLAGSYACGDPPAQRIELGEGLLGQ